MGTKRLGSSKTTREEQDCHLQSPLLCYRAPDTPSTAHPRRWPDMRLTTHLQLPWWQRGKIRGANVRPYGQCLGLRAQVMPAAPPYAPCALSATLVQARPRRTGLRDGRAGRLATICEHAPGRGASRRTPTSPIDTKPFGLSAPTSPGPTKSPCCELP